MKRYYHITTNTSAKDIIADANISVYDTGVIITRLYVNPSYRKLGYGSHVLNEIMKDADTDKLILWATPNSFTVPREKIIKWYEKHGFIYDEEHKMMKRNANNIQK